VACIISTAQHANPNVSGHMEPLLTQLITFGICSVTKNVCIN